MDLAKNKLIIQGAVVTEKSAHGEGTSVYTFKVHPTASKTDVKNAIETMYGVKVNKVHVAHVEKKSRVIGRGRTLTKRPSYKKAMVYLDKKEKALDVLKFK